GVRSTSARLAPVLATSLWKVSTSAEGARRGSSASSHRDRPRRETGGSSRASVSRLRRMRGSLGGRGSRVGGGHSMRDDPAQHPRGRTLGARAGGWGGERNFGAAAGPRADVL